MNTDRLRRLLHGVFVLGLLGTSAELLLLEHFETWQQWLPLALLGLGLLAAVRVGTSPGRRSLAGLRGVAIAFILSGFLGIYFHMKSNFEFERELDSSVHGFRLVGEALTGALPALAPGAMVLLGLIGLVITAGHPALTGEGSNE